MRITLLGATEIDGAATTLSPRDRVVLAALAVSGTEPLTTDQLSDALWGDDPPKSATKVLQGSVVRLRRALGTGAIETTGNGYRLVLEGVAVDAHAFEQLVVRARELVDVHEPERATTTYQQALSLWHGRPLPELQNWDPGRAEALRLLEIRRSAEEELVEARMSAGRTPEAVADARNLVTREPFREQRWALLALALYRSGRQRDALDALRRARATLLDELGIDPGPRLVALEAQILQQDPALLDVPDAPIARSEVCPYPGLRPYDADQSELFVGREDEIVAALERLDVFPLLVIVGASGSGKSSLARAGLVPALSSECAPVIVAPGATPMATLTAALASGDEGAAVVVDQLEELFASADAAGAGSYLGRLTALVHEGRRVIVTLRADHLENLSADEGFARLAERCLVLLTPMSEDQLRRAIEEPARRSGLRLEHGLVDLLVRDVVGEAGGLPLLSHALAETWTRRDGRVLTVEGYTRTGGIRGAVAQSAERLYGSLSPQDRAGLRGVLARLVGPNSTGDPVAVRVPTRVFAGAPDVAHLLDLLVRSRLVTTTSDTVTIAHESLVRAWPRLRDWLEEDIEGQRILQHLLVASDGWEAADRPDDELYRGARLAAVLEWRERAAALLSSTEAEFLDASAALAQREGREREARLGAERRRNRSLRLALVGVVGMLALALVAGSLAALNGRRAQESAAISLATSLGSAALVEPRSDTSLLLARQAVAVADDPVSQSDLLAVLLQHNGLVSTGQTSSDVVSWKKDDQVSPDGTRILVNEGAERSLGDNRDEVFAISPSLLDTSSGRTVTGATLAVPEPGSSYPVTYGAGFVDDGRTVLVSRVTGGGQGQELELASFRTSDGVPTGPAERLPDSLVMSYTDSDYPRVSPDGGTAVSVTNRIVRVWHRDAADGSWTGPAKLPLPESLPRSIPQFDATLETRFSDDGRRAALLLSLTGAPFWRDLRVGVVVDTRSMAFASPILQPAPTEVSVHNPPAGRVAMTGGPAAMALSPDGSTLAVGSPEGYVDLRDLDRPGATPVRVPVTAPVTAVGWSGDGRRLVVGDDTGAIVVVGVHPLLPLAHYAGAGVALRSVFLPGTTDRLIGLDDAGHLVVRQLPASNDFQTVVPSGRTWSVAAGPPGSVVAVGGLDGHVRVYDQATLRPRFDLWLGPYPGEDPTDSPAEHRRVTALAVTPDGSAVIAADVLGHLREWSATDGTVQWTRSDTPAWDLAVSPDGRQLVTLGYRDVNSGNTGGGFWPRFPNAPPLLTTLTLWDLPSHRVLLTDSFPESQQMGSVPVPRVVAFSPDSSLLAAGFVSSLGPLATYDTRTRSRLPVPASVSDVLALTFSPGSDEVLARDGRGTITGFNPRTGAVRETFLAPEGGQAHMITSADGRWIVGSTPTSLEVWDSGQHRLLLSGIAMPSDNTQDALALATTTDDKLFVATQSSLVRIDMNTTHWAARACSLAGRTLTRDEWARHLPDRPYVPACA